MKKIKWLAPVLLAAILFTGCSHASKSAKDYVVLDENLGSEQFGIGFRNDDKALGVKVYEVLDQMVSDGSAKTISDKWFGTDVMLRNQPYLEDATVSASDNSLKNVMSKGKLIVGLDDSFPPMGFRNEKNEIVGFDIDLAREVCKRLGIELVLQPIDWDAKEMELSSGKIDCIWNGMSIQDDRLAAMFIPKAYMENQQIIIVPKGTITKKAQLEGKIVGLQKGSSALDALKADDISKKVKNIVEYSDNLLAWTDLKAGRVDAFVVDVVAGRYIMTNDGK